MHTLRTLEDAVALRAALRRRPRLLIVGAGFIGCEVAASARALGIEVTLIDIAPHPLLPSRRRARRALVRRDAPTSTVSICASASGSRRCTADARSRRPSSRDGTTVDADWCCSALGSVLNTEWLAGSRAGARSGAGLRRDPDRRQATPTSSPPAISPRCRWRSPAARRCGSSTGPPPPSTGQLAGRNALLRRRRARAARAPPYFWSDQYGSKIQALGCPGLRRAHRAARADTGGRPPGRAGVRDGRLVGVIASTRPGGFPGTGASWPSHPS